MRRLSNLLASPGALAVIILAAAPAVPARANAYDATAPTGVETCALEGGPTRTVARILDGETLQLDDGREVRLIGALAPRASDAGAAADAWPAEQQAVRILTELTLGRTVRLAFGGRSLDRYGRHLAHVFTRDAGSETWVQGALLVRGAARAYTLPGNSACAAELLAHERIARQANKGLWALGLYRAKRASSPGFLLSRRSQFELIEAPVASVSRMKSGIYLNFGQDWRADFTVRISKSVLARHDGLEQALAQTTGKLLAVRGWIERRNGPMIDVSDPSQIEFRGDGQAPPALSSATTPDAATPANAPPAAPPARDDGDVTLPTPPNAQRPAEPRGTRPGDVDL